MTKKPMNAMNAFQTVTIETEKPVDPKKLISGIVHISKIRN